MSSPPHQNSTPNLLLPPPSLPFSSSSAAASRRVPPPCWSHDETVALLDAYRNKWYSLRRGNLRAHHWQEVADEITSKFSATPKTSVQCRHKMEKLRKRYRGEKQRAAAAAAFGKRFKSVWIHFKRMDDMERGPDAKEGEDDEEEEQADDDVIKYRNNNISSNNNRFRVNNKGNVIISTPMNNGLNRISLPVRSVPVVAPGPGGKLYNNYDEFGVPNPNLNPQIRDSFGGWKKVLNNEDVGMRGGMGRKEVGVDEEEKKRSAIGEMVEAIRDLGEGFVRAERMKMDMAREIEEMRMEMEMKRTEMILESQEQIVDAFARNVFGSVSKKRKERQNEDC